MRNAKKFAVAGALFGLGFSAYTSYQSFNPDDNQSESMPDSIRYLSELLTQTSMVLLNTVSTTMWFIAIGAVLDAVANANEQVLANKIQKATDSIRQSNQRMRHNHSHTLFNDRPAAGNGKQQAQVSNEEDVIEDSIKSKLG